MAKEAVTKTRYPRNLRLTALIVVQAFIAQQVAFAAPDVKPFDWTPDSRRQTPEVRFELPYSVAFVEDAWAPGTRHQAPVVFSSLQSPVSGQASNKTIILIQDAHTNESGQVNIAKALDEILRKEEIRYVFLEAGKGDVSLSFLRDKAPLEKRREVGMSYLRKGLLQGSEYLDLTSDLDFTLWGVEDQELYESAIDSYRMIVDRREDFKEYLSKIEGTLKALSPKLQNADLLAFDQENDKYLRNEVSLKERNVP